MLREAGGFPLEAHRPRRPGREPRGVALGVGADLPRPALRPDRVPAAPRRRRAARPQDRPGVYRYADGKAVDAEPSTEPPRPAPQSVVVHRFSDEPPFGPMEAFLDRIRAAVSVTTIEPRRRRGPLREAGRGPARRGGAAGHRRFDGRGGRRRGGRGAPRLGVRPGDVHARRPHPQPGVPRDGAARGGRALPGDWRERQRAARRVRSRTGGTHGLYARQRGSGRRAAGRGDG
nr:hypothetical protein [Angustibacter aerolatus]